LAKRFIQLIERSPSISFNASSLFTHDIAVRNEY
jgi:hypothetical protein